MLTVISGIVLWLIVAVGAGLSTGEPLTAGAALVQGDSPVIFVQIPAGRDLEKQPGRAKGTLRADYGDGGRIVRRDPDGRIEVLTEGFGSACEFDVSFDGKRILFAARRTVRDAWNIWEMDADGTGTRQITRDLGNCRSPAYQATLYTIVSTEPWYQLMFVSDAAGTLNELGTNLATSLYSCKLDGSGLRRLTMNPSDDMDPFLMSDGRVLLAGWQRMGLGHGPLGRVSLFGVHTDGADYALFCGDQGRRIKHMACETTDGLVVFVEADKVPWDGAGQLASITLRRNFHSHRAITNDPATVYHSPSPLGDGTVLVAARPADGGKTHGIYRLDPRTGKKELVHDDPALHDLHAKALAPRPQPDGRSSVVNEEYPTGKFYCLNAYQADPAVMPHLKPGTIHRIRVIEGVPLPVGQASRLSSRGAGVSPVDPTDSTSSASGGPTASVGMSRIIQKRLLGVVPVERDGSFQVEVPADVPVQIQTLDAAGMALATCGWIWVKHREPRGCIGCHEDPELAPENRFVMAVRRPGIELTLPAAKRRTVDFRRDLMPIITAKCARCHQGGGGRLDLSRAAAGPFSRAYTSLLTPAEGPRDQGTKGPEGSTQHSDTGETPVPQESLVLSPQSSAFLDPGRARTSPLVWRLFGRNTSRQWDKTFDPGQKFPLCPPRESAQLTDDEKLTFIEWIDLGAQWDGIPEVGEVTASGSKTEDEE